MSIIANIVPMQVIVQPLPEPQIIVENGVVVAIVEQELIIVAVAEQGPAGAALTFEDLTTEQIALLKGDAFTYNDFTPEQLEALRGADGEPFRYEDFTPEQLASLKGAAFTYDDFTPEQLQALKGADGEDLTLEDFNVVEETTTLVNADEFLVKKDGVWKSITKENLKIEKSYFIPFRFYCNVGDVNKYFTHDHYANMNTGLTTLAGVNNDDFLGATGFCHIFNKKTKIINIIMHVNYLSFAGNTIPRKFKISIMCADRNHNSLSPHFNKEHVILQELNIGLYETIDLTQYMLTNEISAGKRMYAAMKIISDTPIGGYVGSFIELIY